MVRRDLRAFQNVQPGFRQLLGFSEAFQRRSEISEISGSFNGL